VRGAIPSEQNRRDPISTEFERSMYHYGEVDEHSCSIRSMTGSRNTRNLDRPCPLESDDDQHTVLQ